MACGPCRGLSPPWTATVQPRARWCTHRSTARRHYRSLVVSARGGGGKGGPGGVGGALTGDGAAIEGMRWGRAPTCERRKGGQCGATR
jgi:hypothetical protein